MTNKKEVKYSLLEGKQRNKEMIVWENELLTPLFDINVNRLI